jgi:hypothetical protein
VARLVAQLGHVLWIGGAPSAGKTTVATRLARRHGLRWYNADTRTWAHRDRALQEGIAAAIRWEAMTPEERWVTSTPAEMLELSLHGERGPMVVDELLALPRSPLVVADGTTLPAAAVGDRSRAVWLIPTPELQRERLSERGHSCGVCEFGLLLGDTIEREAREHDVPILVVDGTLGIDATVAAVEQRFEEALAGGPRAETAAERRVLLREANEAVVAQVRGYHARPWAGGDADSAVRSFLCECGDTRCDESVELAIGAASAAPVLARGHGRNL